jgi:hypothetical protein
MQFYKFQIDNCALKQSFHNSFLYSIVILLTKQNDITQKKVINNATLLEILFY